MDQHRKGAARQQDENCIPEQGDDKLWEINHDDSHSRQPPLILIDHGDERQKHADDQKSLRQHDRSEKQRGNRQHRIKRYLGAVNGA